MKTNIIYVLILFTVFTTACKDLLDMPDPNRIEEKNFWKTEHDAILGLAAVYDGFQGTYLMGESYRALDRLTDNATTPSGTDWKNIEMDVVLTSDRVVEGVWNQLYIIIARANRVIRFVPEIPDMDEEVRDRIIAEAKFLRAYAYYDLTALWGDVPFSLMPKRSFDDPEEATSKETIFAYITDELNTISAHLPEKVLATELGRVPRAAVQALLGKYYLTEQKWTEAASVLKDIIDSKLYELYPTYAELFTPYAEFSDESIFEINFKALTLDDGEFFSVRIDTMAAPIVPTRLVRPTPNLVESYLAIDGKPIANHPLYGSKSPLYQAANRYINRDPRLRASIFTNADNTPGGKKIWAWLGNNSFAVKKYSYLSAEQFPNGGPQNYYVIRYADVLLMYAEAQNEAVGPDDSVHEAINEVRYRAQMPAVPASLDQDEMRQYIRDERRWEFAMEHQRLFDLKRWGILLETANASLPASKQYTEPRVNAWPYPQLEMDRNPALRAQGQNAGY